LEINVIDIIEFQKLKAILYIDNPNSYLSLESQRMSRNIITIHNYVFVNKPILAVWDFTQNYSYRTQWDRSVIEATVLQEFPNRIVRLKAKGNTTMTFLYKLDDRPNKTSLVAKEIHSPLIESAGGSWTYVSKNNGTIWSQTNTIVLKNRLMLTLLLPVFRVMFQWQTKSAMSRAKDLMEMN
jgi:hypothetical protein